MTRAALLAAALAACTAEQAEPDALEPDAALPADAPPVYVPACNDGDQASTPALPVSGTLADGAYRLTWTCIAGCDLGNTAPLRYSDTLTLAGSEIRFSDDDCAECGAEHLGAMKLADNECVSVPGGFDHGVLRASYLLCPVEGGGIAADIAWCGWPGPTSPRVWRMIGAR